MLSLQAKLITVIQLWILLLSMFILESEEQGTVECDVITEPFGFLTSPDYPLYYPRSIDICYRIEATGRPIRIGFVDFELDHLFGVAQDDDCPSTSYHDYIHVYKDDQTVFKGCGKVGDGHEPLELYTVHDYVNILFHSGSSWTSRGFRLKYTTGEQEPDLINDFCQFINGTDEVIATPNYPASYPNNLYKCWVVVLANAQNINLTFNSLFDIEHLSSCASDWIEIRDGLDFRSPRILRWCGNKMAGNIISTSNELYIVFHSDSLVSKSGFQATVQGRGVSEPQPEEQENPVDNLECGKTRREPVFGDTAVELQKWPFAASVRKEKANRAIGANYHRMFNHYCGATVLNSRWLITSASCLERFGISTDGCCRVVGAKRKEPRTVQIKNITRMFIHENPDIDVALIYVDTVFRFNDKVLPICLPTTDPGPNTTCWTAGWGKLNGGTNSTEGLHQSELQIMDSSVCAGLYQEGDVTDNEMCAGKSPRNPNSCKGDWGGPLICTMYDTTEGKHVYTLHGVAIGGDSPCSGNEPTVFTRVSTLNEWIVSTITGHTPDQGPHSIAIP